ncbi:dTDP-4-dehydrorhamnose reductase [Pontibaca salina]|uniref:dTDP-4-dehydrorhamnose reductase n=1 Tax=Pontibaca salina TaxID=2795731 RepID=A0A934LZ89_9RHOB|nr:dTDP-4-dehydrorhamnose reductase [Pontibaca salina]MBI6630642.1 dTDP-4-dehydrorhamnose reductase [Pontibaca salina]
MTILVFGQSGQLARELARAREVLCLDRAGADLSDPAGCRAAIRAQRPAAVINAAAYTAVDRAEAEAALATTINADAPGAMAAECAGLGIPFLSISSDYVFDGTGQVPWKPGDAPAPLGAYGRSKLAGEKAIAQAGGAWAVLRTSWVVSAHGSNFLKTMLRLGTGQGGLRIVADQIGGPTPARDLAAACLTVVRGLQADPRKAGIYHFAGAPDVSWADFARVIFEAAGIDCRVEDIPTAQYPTPAARPLNSRLDCTALAATFGISRPDWRKGMNEILGDLGVTT